MKCPACTSIDNKVIDSRLSKDNTIIRRRRECEGCAKRFTTYERIEEFLPLVVKKDGRRETFDRAKVLAGVQRACEKRPVSLETMEGLVDQIERTVQEKGEREIAAQVIGALLMKLLKDVDQVAYVRFASVYRSFKDVSEFMNELRGLLDKER